MTATGVTVEDDLLLRVLDALLREDVVGLRTRSDLVQRADGPWLRRAGTGRESLLLPVREDGFQCVHAARLPLLRAESMASPERTGPHSAVSASGPAAVRDLVTTDAVLAALAALAEPEDRTGFAAFAQECRAARGTMRLQAATRADTVARLAVLHGGGPARWRGLTGALAYDTLAARTGHPVHPTWAARTGLTTDQLRHHAPEFHPRFALRWLAVPKDAPTLRGGETGTCGDGLWPTPAELGLPELGDSHVPFPVHPLSVGRPLREALRAAGLEGRAVLAGRDRVEVMPTLSMRTVALVARPDVHLKLPLDTSTLGLLNRRTIKPGTLVDGAAAQRLLETIAAREPRFQGVVLHADETRFAHLGHEFLAVLLRTFPAGLDDCAVVPLAALTATAPDGRLVADHLADRYFAGDPVALLDAVLTPVIDWATTLFGYGIALESHQQNISLLLDEEAGRTRLRLLFKDDDGLRIHHATLRRTLPDAVDRGAFDDPRIFVDGPEPLADLSTTITVHLCAGAPAFTLARRGRAPLATLLGLVRDRLEEGTRRLGTRPGQAGALLRARILQAGHLPVKAMVTAGTLLTKERSGAADINKYYTTGPNYLLRSP